MYKIIQNIAVAIAIGTTCVLYIYFAFFYRFSFNYETDINGQYFSVFIAVTALTLVCGLNILKREFNKVQYWVVIMTALLLLVPVFFDRYSAGNEYCTNVLSALILFACLVFIPAHIIITLPYLLIAVLLWQLGIAFEQMNGVSFDADQLNLQGSFQNSGVFCCYLVIHLPLLYYAAFQQAGSKPGRWGRVLTWLKIICFLLVMVFILYIVYCSRSRSAIIAVVAGIAGYCLFTFGGGIKGRLQRIPKWATIGSMLFLLLLAACGAWYLFYLKPASAIGRAMKWKIAAGHIGDHLWAGTGIGRFSWYYPQWQAQYFASGTNPPETYLFSAGESYIIFNEYLQLFETIGLIGFAGFVFLLYWFFKARSVQYTRLLTAMKATMMALLAAGLTTYTFHVNVFLVLMAICFAVAAVTTRIPLTGRKGMIAQILLCIITAYMSFSAYRQWAAVKVWSTAQEIDARSIAKVNQVLHSDGKFLTDYGMWQLKAGYAKEALVTLEKAKQYFISRNTMEALAMGYDQTGNYPAAIITRQWLCNYLPNKFAPRYELMMLYKKAGDMVNVKKIANEILTMPVKIPSAEVNNIKEQARILNDRI